MGAGPVEVAIVAEEIGRVLAPEPFIETVVLAGGLVAAVGTRGAAGEVLGGIAEGDADRRRSRTPSPAPAGRPTAVGGHRDAERRRLDADRRQGAGAQRRPRRPARGQRGRRRRHRAVPRPGRRRGADPHRLPHPRRHPRGARCGSTSTPAEPLGDRRRPDRRDRAGAGRGPRSPTATRRIGAMDTALRTDRGVPEDRASSSASR